VHPSGNGLRPDTATGPLAWRAAAAAGSCINPGTAAVSTKGARIRAVFIMTVIAFLRFL
jgi:hypothetical protein